VDNLKEMRRYLKFKEVAQNRTLWRNLFEQGYGPIVRQTGTDLSGDMVSNSRRLLYS
jgi:hypothetical protein